MDAIRFVADVGGRAVLGFIILSVSAWGVAALSRRLKGRFDRLVAYFALASLSYVVGWAIVALTGG